MTVPFQFYLQAGIYFFLDAQSGKTERLFRFIGAPFRFSGTLVKETGSAYSCH